MTRPVGTLAPYEFLQYLRNSELDGAFRDGQIVVVAKPRQELSAASDADLAAISCSSGDLLQSPAEGLPEHHRGIRLVELDAKAGSLSAPSRDGRAA